MKWTVLWSAEAEATLGELWLAAGDRAELTSAANRIDTILRKDPLQVGESRAADDRIHFDLPLGIIFTADESDRLVRVVRVWRVSRR